MLWRKYVLVLEAVLSKGPLLLAPNLLFIRLQNYCRRNLRHSELTQSLTVSKELKDCLYLSLVTAKIKIFSRVLFMLYSSAHNLRVGVS